MASSGQFGTALGPYAIRGPVMNRGRREVIDAAVQTAVVGPVDDLDERLLGLCERVECVLMQRFADGSNHAFNEPILFIHGQEDDSQASKPIHSHFMYQALRGMGATSKLVLLSLENHRYAARESILHAAAEMIEWFDIHLKNSPAGQIGRGNK